MGQLPTLLTLAVETPLMLPAPADASIIPGMNVIGTIRQRELMPDSRAGAGAGR